MLDMQPDYVPEKQDFYKDGENEGPQHIPNDATGFSTSYIP
jgi:nicotinamidase-related amidase